MLIQNILEKWKSNRIFVLGIDGLGGAGKTTFTQSMEEDLRNKGVNVSVLHIDDFIHPKEVRYDNSRAEWECYYYLQWRYDYLISEILSPIHQGIPIDKEIEVYDKDNDRYINRRLKIEHNSVAIIEGVFLQRPEVRSFLDYVIYLDAPKEDRLSRVLKRDTYIGNELDILTKYRNRYFPAEDKYLEENAPAKNADWTITL